MTSPYSVEIDCSPRSSVRPDEHFADLCQQCSLDPNWFESPSKLFGNWEWNVKSQHADDYEKNREAVVVYLTSLYNEKRVRYASW